MDSKNEVIHTGIVSELIDKGIKVKIGEIAGCASCQIKGSCNLVEKYDKEIFIECNTAQFKPGQRVNISLKSIRGMNSTFLLYILPFFILLIVMLIASVLLNNETTEVIVSLLSLLPYYSILFIFRKKMKKKIRYIVKPLSH